MLSYDHHSPSGLNMFAAQPAMFVLERVLGERQPGNCRMWRGTAVEAGVAYGLLHPDADDKTCCNRALSSYDGLSVLTSDERREKLRDAIPDMVVQALDELRPYGVPTEVQGYITKQPKGLEYPIVGYFDFRWEQDGVVVDLKTTEKMPSQIKIPHARQVSFYCGDNMEGHLTYVTPKKVVTYGLENVRQHYKALLSLAEKVEYFLSKGQEPDDFIKMTAPDLEHYLWGDPAARELAFKYWRI